MAEIKFRNSAPERSPAVILFAETRGFTRTSEMLEPSVVFARVTEFFAVLRAAIARQNGVVRNALNDTLMASFSGDKREQRAVQAAQEIQREFSVFEESWEKDYGIRAAVAIGMHAGNAVTGVTDNAEYWQSLIIGDSVSIAERLLHRARAGEYVLSQPVMDVLVADNIDLDSEELPPLVIPRREPIRLFGVLRDTRLDFT